MINLTFTGSAEEIRADMARLLSAPQITIASPVYAASSDRVQPDDPAYAGSLEEAEAELAAKPAKPAKRGRKPKAETVKLPEGPALNISTGDERVDPETTAQDKAEEAVDLTPYVEPEAKVYTIDDVRNAATPYIKKHTMAMAQLDLQDCLEVAVGIRQISKLNTADQAQLKKAVEAFEAAGKAEARFTKKAE